MTDLDPGGGPLRATARGGARSTAAVPIVRAAHLLVYVEVLREAGAPVGRALARSRLPGWIEELPDAYVSLPLAFDWIVGCSREATVMELGFRAARRAGIGTFGRALREAVLAGTTGFARVTTAARLATRENSALDMRIRREGANVRIVCEVVGYRDDPGLGLAEWLNLEALVSIVQSAAGRDWRPIEMTFVAPSPPSTAALEAYGGTRILWGQRHGSILAPAAVLARPCARSGRDAGFADSDEAWDFAASLRSAIRPYLGDGHPGLGLAAEIAGTSRRTLQRRLADCGRSYSDLVQEARFERARDLLADPGLKIIDVAFAAGYENPQHFSRAFRRLAGVTPTAYRSGLSGSAPAA
jgi:AraC-like DNA-binding protein